MATTRDVIIETLNALRNQHPNWPGNATTQLMNGLLETLDIVDDFDADIPYSGPDPGDLHVHAAAVACRAAFLVTDDGGFARMAGDDQPYEVITADQFFVLVDDSAPHIVAEATRNQLRWWATNKKQKADLAEHLAAAGCPQFAARVAGHVKEQAGVLTRRQRRKILTREQGNA